MNARIESTHFAPDAQTSRSDFNLLNLLNWSDARCYCYYGNKATQTKKVACFAVPRSLVLPRGPMGNMVNLGN